MADNVGVLPSFEGTAVQVATDDIGGRHYQIVKQSFGPDGTAIPIQDTNAGRIPVGGAALGNPDDASAAADDSNTGLLSLFKRSLAKLTSLTTQLPAALIPNSGSLKTGSGEVVLTAKVASGATLQASGSDLAGLRNWGLMIPSTFDGTQIQFQMCDTLAGTYVPVYDITNTRIIMTVVASRFYDIPGELTSIRFLKIECVTAQATTDTDFLIIGKT